MDRPIGLPDNVFLTVQDKQVRYTS